MEEAEKATAQLDAAFKNTGKTLGLTRTQLDDLASEIQNTTTVSDDLVKEGEAILLTFDKVRGQAFQRTITVAADLSARLGTDLKSSIRQVGLALQDPIAGLTLLRRSGIAFTDDQKKLIKGFLDTNQAAKAQELILSELERRFGGSAAAARNTLGGAIAGLKNAFSDLFEGTREGSKSLVDTINSLSKALADPKVKEALNDIVSSLAQLLAITAKLVGEVLKLSGALDDIAKKKGFLGTLAGAAKIGLNPVAGLLGLGIDVLNAGPAEQTPSGGPRRGRHRAPATEAAVKQIEEVNVTVRKIVDQNADALRDLEEETRTSTERVSAAYSRLKAALQTLLDEGKITKDQFNERLQGGIKETLGLEEFDLNEIRAKYQTLKAATTELGEFMKGVWQGVGRSIQATLSDAIYEWNLSWRSLIDIARRALADIASAITTSGIQKLLKNQFSGFSSGGSDQSVLADSFFAFLGSSAGKAGGGRFFGATPVGEDGPEMVFGSGSVMNKRQMAFAGMGGGASINYAPTFNLNIESSGDKETQQRMAQFVDTRIAQSQNEFVRTLQRSGVEVKG